MYGKWNILNIWLSRQKRQKSKIIAKETVYAHKIWPYYTMQTLKKDKGGWGLGGQSPK
jgi:hypothetical protein